MKVLGGALIVSTLTLFAQSNSYYLPQVVDGAVKQGQLTTTIVIVNPAKSTATLSLSFSKDDGTPLRINLVGLVENNVFSISMKPGATRILKTSGTGDGVPGAAQITSNVPISVSVILSAFNSSGKLLGGSGIGSSDTSAAYAIAVDTTGGIDTGIALYNPATTAAALTFTLFNVHGTQATVTENLTGGGHLSRFVAGGLFAGMGSFQGTMTVSSSIPVAGWIVRQSSASPAYTLLKPSPQSSGRLKFYLLEVAEGETGTTKTTTTFQFVNLSANTATVKLSLSHNGGSPWQVSIAGEGTKAAFQFSLPPGGASFWHSTPPSSTTPYATGAALVTSDNPIALTAVATTSDQHGNFIAETGLTEASPVTVFVIPFDLSNAGTGAAFYNPEAQPATLTMTLLDENGNSIAKAYAGLASGGTLSGMMPTFFPHEKLTSGAVSISTGGPENAAISAAALQQLSNGTMLSSSPASPISLTGTPVTITSMLDSSHQASASMSTAGGALNLTDAQGNQFSLVIPANALLSPETIVMTSVTGISGFSQGKFAAGVQLQPEGLELYAPATLTVNLASPVGSPLPLGWRASGPGIYLNSLEPNKTLTMQLMHFSGAGIVDSDEVSATLLQIVNIWDLETSTIAYLTQQLRQQQLVGCTSQSDCSAVNQAMLEDKIGDLYADALLPLIDLAQKSNDNNLLQCAMAHAIEFLRQWVLTGQCSDSSMTVIGVTIDSGADSTFITSANARISKFISDATEQYTNNVVAKCKQSNDPFAGLDVLAVKRQLLLLGDGTADTSTLDQALNACPPTLELDFSSTLTGTLSTPVPPLIVSSTVNFSGEISANVKLQIVFPETSAGTLDNLQTDFIIGVGISGSGPETYSNVSLTDSLVLTDGTTCTGTLAGEIPSTFTVQPGEGDQMSQVKFKFTSQYNPLLVSLGQTVLCNFCPIYQKTPFDVQVLVDPGTPAELVANSCGGMVSPVNTWLALWEVSHGIEGDQGYITGWQLPGPMGVFAEKDISQALSFPSGTGGENTTFKLVNPPLSSNQ